MSFARTFLAFTLATASAAAQAQIYRWLDEKGRVHIGDTPPAGARNVEKRGARSAAQESGEPYALQLARKNAPVTLYSTPNCELCGKARALLNKRGVPFKEVLVTEQRIDELVKAVGANAVPSIAVGSTVQQGFEEGSYHGMLDAAGYPKTGVLPPRAQKEPSPAEPKVQAEPAEHTPRGPYAPGGRRTPQR